MSKVHPAPGFPEMMSGFVFTQVYGERVEGGHRTVQHVGSRGLSGCASHVLRMSLSHLPDLTSSTRKETGDAPHPAASVPPVELSEQRDQFLGCGTPGGTCHWSHVTGCHTLTHASSVATEGS